MLLEEQFLNEVKICSRVRNGFNNYVEEISQGS